VENKKEEESESTEPTPTEPQVQLPEPIHSETPPEPEPEPAKPKPRPVTGFQMVPISVADIQARKLAARRTRPPSFVATNKPKAIQDLQDIINSKEPPKDPLSDLPPPPPPVTAPAVAQMLTKPPQNNAPTSNSKRVTPSSQPVMVSLIISLIILTLFQGCYSTTSYNGI
jgi:hypothetical protein